MIRQLLRIAIGITVATHASAQWRELPPLPDSVGVAGPVVGVHGDALIVGGGANFPDGMPWHGGTKRYTDRVHVFVDGAWRAADERLPRETAYGVSVSTDGGVVHVGGRDASTCHRDVYRLRWDRAASRLEVERLPDLPAPVAHAGGALLEGAIYIAGGQETADGSPTRSLYRLGLGREPRTWERLPDMPGPRRGLPVVAAAAGRLHVFSGRDYGPKRGEGEPFEFHDDVLRFDPSQNRWLDPIPIRVDDASRCIMAGAAIASDRSILLLGGADGRALTHSLTLTAERRTEFLENHPGFSRDVLAFDVESGSCRIVATLPEAMRMPVTTTAVRYGNDVVLPSGEISPGRRSVAVLAFRPPIAQDFGLWNWSTLLVYLLLMVWIGVRCSRRIDGTEEFFLAGRRIPWWAAGLSIFGTQLSAITFMGIPQTTYSGDWVRLVGQGMILVVIPIVVFAYLPKFRGLQLATAYEFLERRFGPAARLMAASLFVLLQLGRMGVVLYLPALALAAASGISPTTCILLMGLLSILYTVLGGLEAVIWTDVVQVIVLIGGALLALGLAIEGVGGLDEFLRVGLEHDKFRIVSDDWSMTGTSLPVIVVGFFFLSLIPYTSDQSVIQRYMATRSEAEAARGLWINFAIILPLSLVFFALGTALFAFYAARPELSLPESDNQIVPWFVVQQMPAGLAGLVIAAIFAASMSSLDSSMNSVATVLVCDFYRRARPDADDGAQLRLGRWLTVALGLIGTGTALLLANLDPGSLFDTFNTILGFFGGALAGLFFLAVKCGWATPRGAVLGTLVGAAAVGGLTLAANAENVLVHEFLYGAIGFVVCVVVAGAFARGS